MLISFPAPVHSPKKHSLKISCHNTPASQVIFYLPSPKILQNRDSSRPSETRLLNASPRSTAHVFWKERNSRKASGLAEKPQAKLGGAASMGWKLREAQRNLYFLQLRWNPKKAGNCLGRDDFIFSFRGWWDLQLPSRSLVFGGGFRCTPFNVCIIYCKENHLPKLAMANAMMLEENGKKAPGCCILYLRNDFCFVFPSLSRTPWKLIWNLQTYFWNVIIK